MEEQYSKDYVPESSLRTIDIQQNPQYVYTSTQKLNQ